MLFLTSSKFFLRFSWLSMCHSSGIEPSTPFRHKQVTAASSSRYYKIVNYVVIVRLKRMKGRAWSGWKNRTLLLIWLAISMECQLTTALCISIVLYWQFIVYCDSGIFHWLLQICGKSPRGKNFWWADDINTTSALKKTKRRRLFWKMSFLMASENSQNLICLECVTWLGPRVSRDGDGVKGVWGRYNLPIKAQ